MDLMLPVGRLYHIAYVVPELTAAMAELGEMLGLTWAKPTKRATGTYDRHRGVAQVAFWLAYSTTGPPHVELIEGTPDTLWDPDGAPRIHHVGMWVDDLATESTRLTELGMPIVGHGVDDDGEFARFTYHENPYGPWVELVAPTTRGPWERWMLGADLELS